MKFFQSVALAGVLICAVQTVEAAPFGPTPKTNLSCRVVQWVWRGTITYQQVGSSGFAFARDIPAHYILLVDAPGADTNLLHTFSSICRSMPVLNDILFEELKAHQAFIILESSRLKELRDGVRLDLTDYTLFCDEFSTSPSCSSVLINLRKPTFAGKSLSERDLRRERLEVMEDEERIRQPPAGGDGKPAPQP